MLLAVSRKTDTRFSFVSLFRCVNLFSFISEVVFFPQIKVLTSLLKLEPSAADYDNCVQEDGGCKIYVHHLVWIEMLRSISRSVKKGSLICMRCVSWVSRWSEWCAVLIYIYKNVCKWLMELFIINRPALTVRKVTNIITLKLFTK